jgi:capsular exopolysaccharide synthesis family protein
VPLQELSPYFIRREFNPGLAHEDQWPGAQEPGFREYWAVIRKHKRLIIVTFLGALLFVGLVVFNMTPLYTAKATVLIQPRGPQVLDIKELMNEASQTDEQEYYKTQYDILQSRSLAARVIRELALDDDPWLTGNRGQQGFVSGLLTEIRSRVHAVLQRRPPGDESESEDLYGIKPSLIDAYLGMLRIEPRFGTHLVAIAFSTPDPVLSARIVNTHVRAYIERGMELHAQASRNAAEFLDKKIAELKERVERSEAALNSYRRDRGIVTFSLDNKGEFVMQRLTDLNTELTKAENDRIILEAEHQLIQNGDYQALPAVVRSELIQSLKVQTAKIAADYASMQSRFNPGYHLLDDLRAKLRESQGRLAEETRRVVKSVESAYLASLTRERELRTEVERAKLQAMALKDASLQDAVLVRELETNRKQYEAVLKRMQELGVEANVPTSNVSVVDAAEAPSSPSSPKVLLSLLLSGFLGLSGGIGLAFFLEYLDDRLKSSEEAEGYLRLPIFGAVPDFSKLNRTGYLSKYAPAQSALEMRDTALDGMSKEIVVGSGNFSVAAEVYRRIRSAILYSRAGGAPKVVMVTSAKSRDGKTVTSLNLAFAFAHMGKRTVLVDADLRRSRCHEALAIDNHLGLAEVLVGRRQLKEVVHQTSSPSLFLLSAGSAPPNPAELLASEAMRETLVQLSKEYDHVIVDSAPVMLTSDAMALATMVDGVVVVVGGNTPKQFARATCACLTNIGAKILGVVLNQIDEHNYGYYGYDSYYHKQ